MKKITLPLVLNNLIEMLDAQNNFRPSEIVKILAQSNLTQEDLLPWAKFDHDVNEGYGRSLVYKGDHFEIMVMSWNARDYSAVHDHGQTKWGAVQVFGKLEHISFHLENNFLSTVHKEKLEAGEVLAVNQNLIHQMGNPYDESTLSIHIYGTPNKTENVTDNSRLYEVGKHEVQIVNGGVFYDLKNSSISSRASGLTADRLTEISHYASLLNQYLKANVRGPQYNKAIQYFQNRSFENRFSFEIEMDSQRILYLIELKKVQMLLNGLRESSKTIDEIIFEINDIDKYS